MSFVSSFWQRNKSAIQSIAKPLISHIPVVGDFAASRIQMSPTPMQQTLQGQSAVVAASLVPTINAVNSESYRTADTSRAVATQVVAPGMDKTYLIIGGVVLLLFLFMFMNKR